MGMFPRARRQLVSVAELEARFGRGHIAHSRDSWFERLEEEYGEGELGVGEEDEVTGE